MSDDTEIKPPDRCPACDWFDTSPLDGKWHYDDGTCYKCGVVWYEYRIAELVAERDGMEERVVATMVERDASVKKLAELEEEARCQDAFLTKVKELLEDKLAELRVTRAGFLAYHTDVRDPVERSVAIRAAAQLCGPDCHKSD